MRGFSEATRQVVAARSGGRCEVMIPATCLIQADQYHHRRPRGMGGSKHPLTDSIANCLHVCRTCHAWIEAQRELAGQRGWLIPHGANPILVPVIYRGEWVTLYPDGWVEVFDTPAGRTGFGGDV